MKETTDVLIIEDDENIQRTFRRVLEKQGYRTKIASNGLEGIALLESDEFDASSKNLKLILVDMIMPDMNGEEFLKARRKEGLALNVPAIVISASDIGNISESAQGVLRKPVELDELLGAVYKFCGPPANQRLIF